MSAGDPAVVVDGLVKRYGERTVLDGVSLTVAAGELVALLGPNGAGKTTTVEIIEGYRRADGGRTRVLGLDPATGGPALRARVGLMLQDGGIDPRARPRETLLQYGGFHADPRDPDELLDLVGLRAVAERAIAGCRAANASVSGSRSRSSDVPRSSSSTSRRRAWIRRRRVTIRSIIADLRDAGLAILLTSHDLTDVERLADRIVVLDDGRVVASGTPAELAAGAISRLRFRLDRPLDAGEAASLQAAVTGLGPGATLLADGDGARYRIDGAPPDAAMVARRGGMVCRAPTASSSTSGSGVAASRTPISSSSARRRDVGS